MSGISGVFAGRRPPGVYRWHAAYDVSDVRHTVEHAGWRFGYVDGWLAESKAEFLDAVGVALDFPDYYGRNFDALNDCLRDLADRGDDTVLLWDGWGPFARADEQAFAVALRILTERAEAVDHERGGRFLVLLRGAGPDLDVESLD